MEMMGTGGLSVEGGWRLGFIGGGFDPVHLGHLSIARDAMEAMKLDRVYFVPARHSPLKDAEPQATDEDRLAMLQLAIANEPRFAVLDWELSQAGRSYTVHTARHLAERFARAQRFWIIGADQAEALARWHRIGELAGLIEFIVLERPGHRVTISAPEVRWHACPGTLVEASSSEVRARLEAGKPVDFLLPGDVYRYIKEHHLYQKNRSAL